MSIYSKLFEIQKKNILLSADADNPFYKSKYVSIENIMSTLKPLLEEQKLLVYHEIESDMVITYVRDTESEDAENHSLKEVSSEFPIHKELDAQKIGAMVTYGKRYNLVALFALIEDDDDGNSLVKNPPKTNETPKQGTKPSKDYITGLQVQTMLMDYKEGKIQVASVESLIEKAQKDYVVAQWAKDKFIEGFANIKK